MGNNTAIICNTTLSYRRPFRISSLTIKEYREICFVWNKHFEEFSEAAQVKYLKIRMSHTEHSENTLRSINVSVVHISCLLQILWMNNDSFLISSSNWHRLPFTTLFVYLTLQQTKLLRWKPLSHEVTSSIIQHCILYILELCSTTVSSAV